MSKKLFCRAPFLGLSVTPTENFCCCMNIKDFTIEEHRKNMYNGNIHNVCKQCKLRHDFDSPIYNQDYIKNINNFDCKTGIIKDFYPSWLHIVYTWKCNCGCKICGTWKYKNEEKLNLKNILNKYTDRNIIKYISLQGGEIFLFKNEVLSFLLEINKMNIPIHIITNGTIVDDYILNTLSKLKNLLISISIDGIYDSQYYMRPGSNYFHIINNIKKIKKIRNQININYTVSIFNIYETINNLIQLKKDIGDFKLNINFVIQPYMYNISSLPNSIKLDILNLFDIKKIIDTNNYEKIDNIIELSRLYKNNNILNPIIEQLKEDSCSFNYKQLYNEVINNDNKYCLNIDILHPKIKNYILSCKEK